MEDGKCLPPITWEKKTKPHIHLHSFNFGPACSPDALFSQTHRPVCPVKENQLTVKMASTCQTQFIINCPPSETTGRICLAVSCWMAVCVCFWKASLASHLQGSSTTSTFTSSPGESKFHMSVTDHVEEHMEYHPHPHYFFSFLSRQDCCSRINER